MSWKTEIKVSDLDNKMKLECSCMSCGKIYYLHKTDMIKNEGDEQLYIDEVEARCKCKQRGCNGKIDVLMIAPSKVSAWVGGMP